MSREKIKELQALLAKAIEEGTIDMARAKRLLAYIEKDLKPIKVRSAKNKGKGLQNTACGMISNATGIPWGNKDEFDIQSRPMGQHGVDIILYNEARKLFPFSVECKAVESFALSATVAQAKANIKPGDTWLIIHKSSKLDKPIAILEFEDLLKIMFKKEKEDNK